MSKSQEKPQLRHLDQERNGILHSEEIVFSLPMYHLAFLSRLANVACIGGGSWCFEVFGSVCFKYAQENSGGERNEDKIFGIDYS